MSELQAKIDAQKAVLTDLKKEFPDWRDNPVDKVTDAISVLKKLIGEQKAIEKAAKAKAKAASSSSGGGGGKGGGGKKKKGGKHLLGLTVNKAENFGHWYIEVIHKAELISPYPISGCYVLRPWAFRVWEFVQDFMNTEFRKLGVQNCYFPMFVTESALTKEEDHLEGFAAEVAWITKSGSSELNEKIALRPTSETVMYPVYADWIRSHRDLPLKLNQWCNVVRWEFKHPTPFLRTREFLWQEGHTAHATEKGATEEVYDILDIYARTYSELLAVPMIKGIKTEKEKFAGGDFTTTVEGYIPYAGRGIQAATSHSLGQNFAKMFNIDFEADDGTKKMPFQNSWGFTTRSLGIAVMVHGDDKGLIMPPRAAPQQVVLIPIPFKDTVADLNAAVQEVAKLLNDAGVRATTDEGTTHNSGFKRSHWELKGVPLRLEIGPRDLEKDAVLMCLRDTAEKKSVKRADLVDVVKAELEAMHARLLAKATAERDAHIGRVRRWEDFTPELNKQNLVLAPFCVTVECEEEIKEAQKQKEDSELIQENGEEFAPITAAAKTLCIPLEQDELKDDDVCFRCGKKAVKWCLFGRSY